MGVYVGGDRPDSSGPAVAAPVVDDDVARSSSRRAVRMKLVERSSDPWTKTTVGESTSRSPSSGCSPAAAPAGSEDARRAGSSTMCSPGRAPVDRSRAVTVVAGLLGRLADYASGRGPRWQQFDRGRQ